MASDSAERQHVGGAKARARSSARYRHVVSLGYFCSTALELRRYGLRDGNYPLDWNISAIEPTLTMVESGFAGFLQRDCLCIESPGVVRDEGSGIAVYNDFDPALPVAVQYEAVRRRYEQRIQRFCQAIRQRTLFVRYINDLEEFTYLDENMPGVLAVLRRTHPTNDLLLVANTTLPAACGGLPVYRVEPDPGDGVARRFVSKNARLRWRLITLPYPLGRRARNLALYWSTRARRSVRFRTRLRALRQP